MREAEVPALHAGVARQLERLACEGERWRAGTGTLDPHVVEAERAEPEAERLHHRFTGGETGCERWDRIGFGSDVCKLDSGEQPLAHRRGTDQRSAEPFDLDDVDADPDHSRSLLGAAGPAVPVGGAPISIDRRCRISGRSSRGSPPTPAASDRSTHP